jgi:hypothetical protein
MTGFDVISTGRLFPPASDVFSSLHCIKYQIHIPIPFYISYKRTIRTLERAMHPILRSTAIARSICPAPLRRLISPSATTALQIGRSYSDNKPQKGHVPASKKSRELEHPGMSIQTSLNYGYPLNLYSKKAHHHQTPAKYRKIQALHFAQRTNDNLTQTWNDNRRKRSLPTRRGQR